MLQAREQRARTTGLTWSRRGGLQALLGTGGDVAPMISLSVPVLLTTVKKLVPPETHEQLDQMLQRYMQREIGKQQVCSSSSPISTPPYLTLAACRSPHPLPPGRLP